MNYIYFDANIYLKFYLGNKLFKIVESLTENKDNIIVTDQIVNEVFRNSVSITVNNLNSTLNNLKWQKPSLPYKNASKATLEEIDNVYRFFGELKTKIESDLNAHLNLVSSQEDEVSKKLKEIFLNSLKATEHEINLSKEIKRFGNPPGKKQDPIGDELSWIQLVNKLQNNDKLVLVTNDRDYASLFNNNLYLNSKLFPDLKSKNVEYFIYSEIVDGLKKLKELQDQKFKPKDYPSVEDQKQIKEEEKKIMVDTTQAIECIHSHVARRMNGIYDQYVCLDCGRLLFTTISDDLD